MNSPPLVVGKIYKMSSNSTPIILCDPADASILSQSIISLASQKRIDYHQIDLSSSNEEHVSHVVSQSANDGHWVILDNAHKAKSMILRGVGLFILGQISSSLAHCFRLWFTHQGDFDPTETRDIPSSILVSALIGKCSGEIISSASVRSEQVKQSYESIAAFDILALEEKIYTNDKSVQTLILSNYHIPHLAELMETIKQNKAVRTLVMNDMTITAVESVYIGQMLKLNLGVVRLSLVRCTLTDDCISELCNGLRNNHTLRELDLSDNPSIADAGLRLISSLLYAQGPGLRVLEFRNNNSLRHHINPEKSGFHHSSVRVFARALKSNTTLTILDLSGTRLISRSVIRLFRTLVHNKTLTSINLSNNRFGDEPAVVLSDILMKKNNTLKILDLSSTGLSVVSLSALGRALNTHTALSILKLNSNRIVQLPEPQQLSNAVHDEYEDIGDDPLPEANWSSGEEEDDNPSNTNTNKATDIPDNVPYPKWRTNNSNAVFVVPDEVVEKAVKTIAQRYHRLEGIAALAETLHHHKDCSLHTLELGWCAMDSESIRILCNEILANPNGKLKSLSLEGNDGVDEDASVCIKELIMKYTSLTEINLARTTSIIAERAILALAHTPSLTTLDVSFNNLSDGALIDLVDAIQLHPSCPLQTLIFAFNSLTSIESFASLSKLLINNLAPRLKTLDLTSVTEFNLWPEKIATEAITQLSQSLQRNSTLTELRLASNGIDDGIARILARSLPANRSIKLLDLRHNYIRSMMPTLESFSGQLDILTDGQTESYVNS